MTLKSYTFPFKSTISNYFSSAGKKEQERWKSVMHIHDVPVSI